MLCRKYLLLNRIVNLCSSELSDMEIWIAVSVIQIAITYMTDSIMCTTCNRVSHKNSLTNQMVICPIIDNVIRPILQYYITVIGSLKMFFIRNIVFDWSTRMAVIYSLRHSV